MPQVLKGHHELGFFLFPSLTHIVYTGSDQHRVIQEFPWNDEKDTFCYSGNVAYDGYPHPIDQMVVLPHPSIPIKPFLPHPQIEFR